MTGILSSWKKANFVLENLDSADKAARPAGSQCISAQTAALT
jgi:hypothetical protein